MNNLGMGVMLGMMGGNEETVNILRKSIGETINKIEFNEDALILKFDKHSIRIRDDGQSCCEHRYMTCDDNLKFHEGSIFMDIEIASAPSVENDYDVHEVQFLKIKTNNGGFTIETHNEHNGYYGGFWIVANEI